MLGRPWRPYGKSVFIGCELGLQIKPAGWSNWGDAAKEKTAFFAEFGNSGPGASLEDRLSWMHQLNEDEARKFTRENILGDWAP